MLNKLIKISIHPPTCSAVKDSLKRITASNTANAGSIKLNVPVIVEPTFLILLKAKKYPPRQGINANKINVSQPIGAIVDKVVKLKFLYKSITTTGPIRKCQNNLVNIGYVFILQLSFALKYKAVARDASPTYKTAGSKFNNLPN